MALRLVTAPVTEPVSRAEARAWARMSDDEPDWIVDMLIGASRERAEHLCGRGFTTKTWELALDAFPAAELSLEVTPVASIESVKYLDTTGVQQTFNSAGYVLDSYAEPAFIIPADGYEWPETFDSANAVKVRFVQGWSTNPIPELNTLRRYMCMEIATGHDFRSAMVVGRPVNQLSFSAATTLPAQYYDRILDPLRAYGV